MEADIQAGVKDWNEDPKLFIWTKTAEEILDSLAPSADESPAQDASALTALVRRGGGRSGWTSDPTTGVQCPILRVRSLTDPCPARLPAVA
ncbi:hypothetical protein OG806_48050 [Streptomyces sp. NBC_00882]|uniref:hypothetical protein n=1 Tax=Streptomyces TaxID=1883 RepID=UPI00386DA622|nr:hypothetical protein OG806_48050 [Streptomyces sp. NBC_00882]WSZ63543.1 hypothetical protein OH824_46890 [Streptomyces canus]